MRICDIHHRPPPPPTSPSGCSFPAVNTWVSFLRIHVPHKVHLTQPTCALTPRANGELWGLVLSPPLPSRKVQGLKGEGGG